MSTPFRSQPRRVARVVQSIPTSDGAGVKLRRSIGSRPELRLDPFLMLDEFSSDQADDYIKGFPAHPHRGFETVTYMLDGHMRHEDHLGNRGELTSGSVQWMTAGRGIVHSEMPQQRSGRMRGFQLWINLPAREKMKPASYRDIAPEHIPSLGLPGGGQVKIIAGTASIAGSTTVGPINGGDERLSTDPLYLDVVLPADTDCLVPVESGHNAFVYVYEGEAWVGPEPERHKLPPHAAGILSPGNVIVLRAGGAGARMLVLAARPLNEPVVQYGPFVMNSREEIEQALRDYQSGAFVSH